MKRLIVNADDFGRTRGINSGTLDAHLYGIVTSATVMVLEPAAEEGVAEVLRRAPRLSLGLHWVVTGGGLPASSPDSVRSFLVEGRFPWFPPDLPPDLEPEEAARELDAQIYLFERMAGRLPAHLDSHHHAALHPALHPVFVEAARRLGVPARASSDAARAALRAAGVRTPDRFLDGFYADGATPENLGILLRLVGNGTSELMCHPGRVDERLLAGSSYARERERELGILCDPELKRWISERGIELIGFREL